MHGEEARGDSYPHETAHKLFVRFMREQGYDGLTYKNIVEDKGRRSWVIFHPSQAWHTTMRRWDKPLVRSSAK